MKTVPDIKQRELFRTDAGKEVTLPADVKLDLVDLLSELIRGLREELPQSSATQDEAGNEQDHN
jgi:hypothetical protein